jgi:hypothetical protein
VEYSCSIPNTKVQSGDKLVVRSTWESREFGRIVGEKIVVWK